MNRFLPLVLVILVLLLSSCSERSEYEKLGAACIATEDVTQPSVSSVSPADNSTYNSPATTVALTFSENMATGSVTTNTNDTTCSGSFQLSSDNFTTCIKMSAAPVASDNDTTFTITPTSSLSAATTFKVKITTSVTDISCNTLASAYLSDGFTTTPSGSGTIRGSVKQDNGSALSGVSVSFSLYGSTVTPDNTTTDNNGDFSRSSLNLGINTLTYAKSGYNDTSLSATLATDNQTLVVATLTQIANTCSAGTVSGTISDAVNGNAVSDVTLSVRSGLNVTSGTVVATATTDNSGNYSLSSMNAGWYTIQTSKSGYIAATFKVYACGNKSGQDGSISPSLSVGSMRIVLTWNSSKDLDSHLRGPDNASGKFHVYYSQEIFYYAKNDYSCSGCSDSQKSDNVTLDVDNLCGNRSCSNSGPETITISAVRSGTYRYYASNNDNTGQPNNQKLAKSEASVNVYYNDTVTTYNVPNIKGDLWTVFDFDTSSGLTAVNNMGSEATDDDIDDH